MEMINAIGRRKASVARVFFKSGKANITINGKEMVEYFPQKHIQTRVTEPFEAIGEKNTYDIQVIVDGGGYKGQSEAIRMAISRALVEINEDYRKPLKVRKFLTRDSRIVERKKYGKPKARKSFQFSKR